MKLDKKAQGISINVIIIAAIALLVLVVLSVVFTGRMGIWSQESSSCEPNIGRCAPPGAECGEEGTPVADYPTEYRAANCPGEDQKCCTIGS